MRLLNLLPLRHAGLFVALLAAPWAVLAGRQSPPATAPNPPRIVRLDPAEAARLAAEARRQVKVEMAAGVDISLFAPDGLIADPIAIDLDERGTLYATSSSRASLPLDIRGHPSWVPTAHALRSHDDLVKFYQRELAPARSAQNGWIDDLNKDGSHDARDLTELKERLVRIQDTNGDGIADLSQVMAEGFNADPTFDVAGGLLHHAGDLFFGIAPGLWRLRDTNGDGSIDTQTPVSVGYNTHPAFGGHGISGVTLGPDGRIYWEVGDIGYNVVDQTGRRWAAPNQGAVFRANPDGSDFEVFATGIRNLQEFAFDELGNLISVDNDGDHEGETERLVYIPEGSDSGWRANWQYGKYTDPANNRYNVWMDEAMFKPRFTAQAAHIVPPIAPYHTGPSGLVFNPGTALSDEWRNHFFVTSFPGSADGARVYGFTLKPDGAGFALDADKVLLRGILSIGMKFGPDGALYLTDWITGWTSTGKGRIWKLDTPAATASPMRKEVAALLREDLAARPVDRVAALLRHADMRVRQKAQFDLVRRGDTRTLVAAATDRTHLLARVHALWGLGQLARKDAAVAASLTPLLGDAEAEVSAQAARLLGDLRHRDAAAGVLRLLAHESARVRFFAAEALGRMAHRPAVAPLVAMLQKDNGRDVYLRHAGSLALSRIGDAPALAALATHESPAVRTAAVVALRRMRHANVARFLADRDEHVATEAARAVNDDGGIEAGTRGLAALLGETPFTGEPLLRRAISANLRLGTTAAVARLAAFADTQSRAEALRVEAIGALGVFLKPSNLNRVDGMYQGAAAPRAASTVAARAAITRLLAGRPASAAIRVALASAAGDAGARASAPLLRELARSDDSPEVRVASLRALQALHVPGMGPVVQTALRDPSADVRRAALAILPGLPIPDAARAQQLRAVLDAGAIDDQQAALAVLATMKTPPAERLLLSYVDRLAAGTVPPALQLDVVDAAQANGSAALRARLDSLQRARSADTLAGAFREALLAGGNAVRGREVFAEHPAAACTRCHAVGTGGSDVGPNLTTIGSSVPRPILLEALLEPSARIAPGFGSVSLTLRSGERLDGTLREETAADVAIVTPTGLRRVPRQDIASRTNPVSAMPPMGQILKLREIRDVVEFLSTLK